MKHKLRYSQNILAGMTRGDYKMIAKQAAAMKFMNRIEGVVRCRSTEYRKELATFSKALDRIEKSASHEDLDGVTQGFFKLTGSCVQCHRQLREWDNDASSDKAKPAAKKAPAEAPVAKQTENKSAR